MYIIKKFSQNRIFYICLLIFAFLTINVMGKSSEIETTAVATILGIDTTTNGIELSASIVVPKSASGVDKNLQAVAAEGTTISNAIYKLGIKLGKKIGLAHCEAIVLSNDILAEDAVRYLDYFIRTNNMTTNAVVLNTNSKAKEVINALSNGEDPYSLSLKNLIDFDDHLIFSIKMNIENFYKAYYDRQGIALIGVFNVATPSDEKSSPEGPPQSASLNATPGNVNNANTSSPNASSPNASSSVASGGGDSGDSGAGGGEDENGGGSEGSGGGSESDYVDYQANVALIKGGKKIRELSQEEIDILRLIHPYVRSKNIDIENINTTDFKDGHITLEVFNKRVQQKHFFNNGVPTYKLKLKLFVKFDESMASFYTEGAVGEVQDFLYPEVKMAATEKLRKSMSILIKNSQNEKADILGVYDMFYRFQNKEWKKFLQTLDDPEDYLTNIVYELEVDFDIKF